MNAISTFRCSTFCLTIYCHVFLIQRYDKPHKTHALIDLTPFVVFIIPSYISLFCLCFYNFFSQFKIAGQQLLPFLFNYNYFSPQFKQILYNYIQTQKRRLLCNQNPTKITSKLSALAVHQFCLICTVRNWKYEVLYLLVVFCARHYTFKICKYFGMHFN